MFGKWFKGKKVSTNNATTSSVTSPGTITVTIPSTVAGANIASTGYTTYGNITSANPIFTGNYTVMGGAGAGGGQFSIGASYSQPHIISLSNNGQEIVRLNKDGTVTWNNGIHVDEAAEAFGRALSYSAELKAGITKRVKADMRDSVFNDIINIAKEKGSLTADDLTYLLEASKIMEKLKGGNE